MALAAMARLELDPWQQAVLHHTLAERADGRWAAMECGLVVPRQNGKGSSIEARELAGLFLLGERKIVHTAHNFSTAMDALDRLTALIEETPQFAEKHVKTVRSHGAEGIIVRPWYTAKDRSLRKRTSTILFKTRTMNNARGLSGDLVILDEAMILAEAMMASLFPLMSARPNPQIWYTGSAVDADEHQYGQVLTRVRNRAIAGDDPGLCYLEWSAPEPVDEAGEQLDGAELAAFMDDLENWRRANPSLNIRITEEYVTKERRAFRGNEPKWLVERLGCGNWPAVDTEDEAERALDPDVFAALVDEDPVLTDVRAIAVDRSPDRRWVSIAAATIRGDGRVHVEVGYHGSAGPNVLQLVRDLVARWDPCAVVIDRNSTAAPLINDLLAEGVEPETTTGPQMAQACGAFADDVDAAAVTFTGDPLLQKAVEGAAWRKLGGAKAFAAAPGAVITPLVAVALARHGVRTFFTPPKPPPPTPVVADGGGGVDALTDDVMHVGF